MKKRVEEWVNFAIKDLNSAKKQSGNLLMK